MNDTKFRPGQSGNPGGRPKLSLEQREFRLAAKGELIEEFKYLWSLTSSDLTEIVQDELTPVIRLIISKAMLKAVETGDMNHIDKILDRVIGKVKDEIDLNTKGSLHCQIVNLINNIEEGSVYDSEPSHEVKPLDPDLFCRSTTEMESQLRSGALRKNNTNGNEL